MLLIILFLLILRAVEVVLGMIVLFRRAFLGSGLVIVFGATGSEALE